jgi:hypothetical protein
VLGKKLGEGAFGVVYKASLANREAADKVNATCRLVPLHQRVVLNPQRVKT